MRIIAVGFLCLVPAMNAIDENVLDKNGLTLSNITVTDVVRIGAEGLIGYKTGGWFFKEEEKKAHILFALGGMYKGYKHVEYQKKGEKFPVISNILLNGIEVAGFAKLGLDCGEAYGHYFYPDDKGAMVGSAINGALLGYIAGILLGIYPAYNFDPKKDRKI